MKDYIVTEGSISNIDWEAFRREATKDILAGFAANGHGVCKGDVAYAIELADELIKQLKEDKQ